MSDDNGITGAASVVAAKPDQEPYRPKASTAKVFDVIERSLREVISEATHQAGSFAFLSGADREKGVAVQYGHLIDASECLETAITYLGMLKQVVSHRLRVEDETNIGDTVEF